MDPLMTFWIFLIGALAGLIAGIALVYRMAVSPLHKAMKEPSDEQSSVKNTDRSIDQFDPTLLNNYPFSYENFRFIGDPIGGIQFDDDRVIFVDFKANQSESNPVKKRIKDLVESGKIEWLEFKVE